MKNLITLLMMSAIGVLVITSCAKEELTDLAPTTEEAEARIAGQPDLIITYFMSSLPNQNGPCPGPPKPNAGCNGGTVAPTFTFKAVVENVGTADVPPNSGLVIRWNLFGSGGTNTSIPQKIPAGSSLVVVSGGPYSLPCPSGPPPYQLINQTFFATIDATGAIAESNENNNFSSRLVMCDDA